MGGGGWQAQATNLEFLKYCSQLDHNGLTNRKRNGPSTAHLPLGLRLTELIVLVTYLGFVLYNYSIFLTGIALCPHNHS
jgi:hypothetical protein